MAAESFLKHGGNLHGCEDVLRNIPEEARDQLRAVLLERKATLLEQMKTKKEVIELMEAEQKLPEMVARLDDAKLEKFQDEIDRLNLDRDPKTVYSKERLELTSLGALAQQNARDSELLASMGQ